MAAITHEFQIYASKNNIFKALTKGKGMMHWWTCQAKAEPEAGSTMKVEFGSDFVEAKVEKAEPSLIVWKVVASKMLGVDDWVGTRVTFKLEQKDGFVTLHFTHDGWKKETECFRKCTDGWSHYLGTSLKEYLETGNGKPFKQENSTN